jgi:hypothetical protein
VSALQPNDAFDDSKYPNFSGIWRKPVGIGNQWDQTKPLGRAQEPPFTPEYQAIFEASLADIKAGGQGNDAPSRVFLSNGDGTFTEAPRTLNGLGYA